MRRRSLPRPRPRRWSESRKWTSDARDPVTYATVRANPRPLRVKSEIRSSKSETNSKYKGKWLKSARRERRGFEHFRSFGHSDLFRILSFEFRISRAAGTSHIV